MKRHTLYFSLLSLVVILTATAAIVLHNQSTKAATLTGFSVTVGCTDFTSTGGTLYLDRENTVSYDEAYYYQVFDGAGKVVARYPPDGVFQQPLGDTQGYGGVTLSYNIAMPDYNPLTYQFVSAAGMGMGESIVYSASGNCDGLPNVGEASQSSGSSDAPARVASAGSDMVIIPPTAVVGMFVQDTPLYYAPSPEAVTDATMTAGQTLYVYGVDASGGYYEVLIGGSKLWVPVASMGPNTDATWNGKPLPSNVVG